MDFITLAVVGGSSVGTPVLLGELHRAVMEGQLPKTHVRLFGRNLVRLERILNYFGTSTSGTGLSVSIHTDLKSAVADATHVLCQVRPGGMELRAQAERAALAAGIPGDEGLGPGGLAVFLLGRPVIENLINQCARYAPNALFLQMTSPLGLFVAVASSMMQTPVYGLCELPAVTAKRVMTFSRAHAGLDNLSYSLAGLNHQSWLFDFRDTNNIDRTQEVLSSINDPGLVDVDPSAIREFGAVPVPYLKLFVHGKRELDKQRALPKTRGEELMIWNSALHRAYCDGLQPDTGHVSTLLEQRDMGWYRHGVVPALKALASKETKTLPLNLQNRGVIQGVDQNAIVEVLCAVSNGMARPISTSNLPDWPAKLTRDLAIYEKACLDLPDRPSVRQLETVLAAHPMVPHRAARAAAEQVHAVIMTR